MKKPDKVVQWLHVSKEPYDPFVNHNGKPLFKYFIELPYWLVTAYNPFMVKIEVNTEKLSYNERMKQTNHEEIDKYVKANWSKKLRKMRKINHNYIFIEYVTPPNLASDMLSSKSPQNKEETPP